MLWRGARDWPVFLSGRSMIVAGGLHAKVVVYPIAEGSSPASRSDQLGGAGEESGTAMRRRPAARTGRGRASARN